MTAEQQQPEAADRNVRMSPELMHALFTRDQFGNRLRVTWGEPGEDGFYEPTVTVDFSDNVVNSECRRIDEAVRDLARCPDGKGLLHPLVETLRVLAIVQGDDR